MSLLLLFKVNVVLRLKIMRIPEILLEPDWKFLCPLQWVRP
jgi:hypothetical protein